MYVVNSAKDKFDIYIGRPSKYSNNYHIGIHGNRKEVLFKFEYDLYKNPKLIQDILKNLQGKFLGCHCTPLECHGDLLARIANRQQLCMPLVWRIYE